MIAFSTKTTECFNLKHQPELTNITKRPPITLNLPEDLAFFLPEIYDNLEASDDPEQQNAIHTILQEYLNPVDSKNQNAKAASKP